jgi:DNA modification methylase
VQRAGASSINPNPLSCRYCREHNIAASQAASAAFFTHSTERILWAAKTEKSRHVFNYRTMKAVTGKQMKTVWQFTALGRAEKIFGKHPTQKPVALVERCLLTAATSSL